MVYSISKLYWQNNPHNIPLLCPVLRQNFLPPYVEIKLTYRKRVFYQKFVCKKRVVKETNKKKNLNTGLRMDLLNEISKKTANDLEECIQRAMDKAKSNKELDLCKYIPVDGGRLHHLAYLRMKEKQPSDLLKMIKEHILENENIQFIAGRPRSDLMIKRKVELKFKRNQIARLLELVKKSGDQELISLLSPHQSLAQIQKLMIEMIKSKKVDQELWSTYVNLVEVEKSAS